MSRLSYEVVYGVASEIGELLYEAYYGRGARSFRVLFSYSLPRGVFGRGLQFQRFPYSYVSANGVAGHQTSRFVVVVLRCLRIVLGS